MMRGALPAVLMLCPLIAVAAHAQSRTLRIVGDDSIPVAFANVTLAGERPRIADERGELDLGATARGTLTLDVRRLGYEPWAGTVALGDTASVARITLRRISRRLFTVKITDSSAMVPAYLRGFYQRMLDRQRGIGTGFFITPEDIERRTVSVTTSLLQGLNGVAMARTATGKVFATNSSGSCVMAVLVDGHRVCPARGCDGTTLPAGTPPPAAANSPRRRGPPLLVPPTDDQYVLIDNVITPNQVAAVEVYARGASVPLTLPTPDNSCGTIAIWTGGRQAP